MTYPTPDGRVEIDLVSPLSIHILSGFSRELDQPWFIDQSTISLLFPFAQINRWRKGDEGLFIYPLSDQGRLFIPNSNIAGYYVTYNSAEFKAALHQAMDKDHHDLFLANLYTNGGKYLLSDLPAEHRRNYCPECEKLNSQYLSSLDD